jgi:sulfur carrier protein
MSAHESPASPELAAHSLGAQDIIVHVNGATHVARAGTTLADLLAALGEAPEQCATAVNEAFVARALRSTHLLRDGDRITCFKPIVGG